jgi:hypothetical protein
VILPSLFWWLCGCLPSCLVLSDAPHTLRTQAARHKVRCLVAHLAVCNTHTHRGESGKQFEELWQQLNTAYTRKDACMRDQMQATSLYDAVNAGMLSGLQRGMSLKVADKLHSQLLNRYQAILACANKKMTAEQH